MLAPQRLTSLFLFAVAAHACITSLHTGRFWTCAQNAAKDEICWGLHEHKNHLVHPSKLDTHYSQHCYGKGSRYLAHSCGILAIPPENQGELDCWGEDIGRTHDDVPQGKFLSVSCGGHHTCAIRDDHTAVCWGVDHHDQSKVRRDEKYEQISAGAEHTCTITEHDHTLYCWGVSIDGQSPKPPHTYRAAWVSAGWYHSCAVLLDSREAVCWGYDGYGQCKPPAGAFTLVECGFDHTCGLRTDNRTVECWGRNGSQQLLVPDLASLCTAKRAANNTHTDVEQSASASLQEGDSAA